jgi:glutamine synthetase adenylyltransferase
MRQKIERIARKLGHEPDPEVARLMTQLRTRQSAQVKATLALLTSGSTAQAWTHSVTERKYEEGAIARARQLGYASLLKITLILQQLRCDHRRAIHKLLVGVRSL